MAATLTDFAWADICAAGGLTPDAEARAALSAFLFEEYPAFAYDREGVARKRKRSERMLKHLAAIAELYRQALLPDLSPDQFQAIVAAADDIRIEAELWSIKMLQKRASSEWLAARAIQRANARRKSPQRELLYHRLCGVWLDHFGANALSYSVPSLGGSPHGPLIAFMLAAIRQVVPEDALPDAETVRDAIDRERAERERAKQLNLFLRLRGY